MIIISGILKVAATDRDKALDLVRPLVSATREESGCVEYGFWEDPNQTGSFRVFEEWENEEALTAHFTAPHMTAFMTAIGGLKIESMDLSKYESSGRKPVF